MALLEINWNPNRRQLRQFAVIWVIFFALIGAYCLWAKDSAVAATIIWSVAAVGLAGVVWPGILRPVYVVWMALATPIGWTISHLLILFVYYLVITPIGLGMRLFGYDPMERRLDRSAGSYWTPHDPGAEPSRYFRQY
jgi:hypothetical protein